MSIENQPGYFIFFVGDERFLQKVLQEAADEVERIAPECMIQANIEIV